MDKFFQNITKFYSKTSKCHTHFLIISSLRSHKFYSKFTHNFFDNSLNFFKNYIFHIDKVNRKSRKFYSKFIQIFLKIYLGILTNLSNIFQFFRKWDTTECVRPSYEFIILKVPMPCSAVIFNFEQILYKIFFCCMS